MGSNSSKDKPYIIPESPFGIGYVESGDGNLLYIGHILTPSGIMAGEMLIDEEGEILYVGKDSSGLSEAQGATRLICYKGLAVPGFIDGWRHKSYAGDIPVQVDADKYDNRTQWRRGIDGKNALEYSARGINAWDDLALVMGGTTTLAANSSSQNKWMIRTLDSDEASGGLISSFLNFEYNSFPLGNNGSDPADYDTPPNLDIPNRLFYAAVVADGIDDTSRNEFLELAKETGADFLRDNSVLVHGAALTTEDLGAMAEAGTSLVWTPYYDLNLYGNTAQVVVFDKYNGNIALGSSWNATGSLNTLLELQTAYHFNATYLNRYFTDKELIDMATINGARAYGLDYFLGTLETGKRGDFTLFSLEDHSGYNALFQAGLEDIALVAVDGKVLYGDSYLTDDLVSHTADSEILSLGSSTKRIFSNRDLGYSIAELENEATSTPYDLIFNPHEFNPQIVPAREGEYTGIPTSEDRDGDGIADSEDNAPEIFNPIRPVDKGFQADLDGDGIGDVADSFEHHNVTPDPVDPSPVVIDTDIVSIRTGIHEEGTIVTIEGAVVTAVYTGKSGVFWVQDPEVAAGTEYSGILVYPDIYKGSAPSRGDKVNLRGIYEEFNTISEIYLESMEITASGMDIDPVILDAVEIGTGDSLAEPFESMLVRVENVTVIGNNSVANSASDSEGLIITDYLYGNTFSNFNPGDDFTSITGVMDYYYYTGFQLAPRDEDDLVAAGN